MVRVAEHRFRRHPEHHSVLILALAVAVAMLAGACASGAAGAPDVDRVALSCRPEALAARPGALRHRGARDAGRPHPVDPGDRGPRRAAVPDPPDRDLAAGRPRAGATDRDGPRARRRPRRVERPRRDVGPSGLRRRGPEVPDHRQGHRRSVGELGDGTPGRRPAVRHRQDARRRPRPREPLGRAGRSRAHRRGGHVARRAGGLRAPPPRPAAPTRGSTRRSSWPRSIATSPTASSTPTACR